VPADSSAACPSPKPPSNESAATASNARNQTANRVPEFCFRKTRSSAQAKSAIRIASGNALRMRSTDTCATLCRDDDNEDSDRNKEGQFISRPSEPGPFEPGPFEPSPSEPCPSESASPADDRFPLLQCLGPRGDSRPVAPANF